MEVLNIVFDVASFASKDNTLKGCGLPFSKLVLFAVIASIAIAITLGVVILFTTGVAIVNYDSAPLPGPWTTNNLLGFSANIVYVLNPTDATCPIRPCETAPAYMLKYASENETFLLGYSICNEGRCLNNEQIVSQVQSDPDLIKSRETWSSLRLGDLDWNVGDTVNIKAKLAPVISNGDDLPAPDTNNIMYVDLGDSEIIQLESG